MFRLSSGVREFLISALISAACTSAATVTLAAADVQSILDQAYMDELKAYVRYESIIAQFGEIRPFANLIESERQHLDELSDLYLARGLTPAGVYEPADVMYLSVASACAESLDAEKDNVALYDRLLKEVTDPDVVNTFSWLRRSSEERHIPALMRCSTVPN